MGGTISTTQWYLYGRKHFTKTGYERHMKNYNSPVQVDSNIGIGMEGADGVDMSGKVVIITGANSGIGKEMATYAAAKGANLYMMCRSEERAKAAQQEIVEKTKNQNVEILLADVSESKDIQRAVQQFQSKETKLDCLVCNAGILPQDRQVNSAGMEKTLASHLVVGSHLLCKLLMPQLKKADQPRVVFVTSGGMLLTNFPSWDIAASTAESHKFDGTMAYSYAKRGQVILAQEWSKKYPGIVWMSAHPGWTDTGIVDDAFGDGKKYLEPMRSTWEGAEGIAWMMATDASKLENGAFYLDRKPQKKHVAGPFFSEGSLTKNTSEEVEEMMKQLEQACAN